MTNKLPSDGLQNLILNHKGDRSFARLSTACGGIPTTVNLHRLATGSLKNFPTADVLMGLSKGLGVRLVDVLHAAAVSVGMPIHASTDDDLLIPEAGRLPEESRRLLLDTAQNMLWWMEQVDASSVADGDHEGDRGETPDNVHQLRAPKWSKVADAGEPGVDPEQLPDE